jgi:acyl-CoA dehydrogenase
VDFAFNDEHRMILEYGDHIAQEFDRDWLMAKTDAGEFPWELWHKLGDDGFIGTMVPEEYGGAGLGMTELTLLTEGLCNNGLPLLFLVVSSAMAMGHLAKHGAEEQKRRYLPDCCTGRKNFCFAITEANAGTNSMKIETVGKPVPAEDGRNEQAFKLSGSKTFITGADVADHAIVVARTTPFAEAKSKTDGFSLFIVDLNAEGVERHQLNINVRAPETQWQLFYDEVALTEEDVVGEVGKGFRTLFDMLNPERIMVAAMAVGIGRYALRRAVEYASERQVFDAPIGSYQGLQHPLAIAQTEVEMAALMTYKAAWAYDQGLPAGEFSNMAKYFGAEAGIKAVDTAVQCFGGNAYTKEYGIYDLYPIVRLLRTAPINREMILNYIGEHVMGLPRSY